ncbi:MAG TPA: flagellar basal body L-ring protein FlgH [Limnochordales bacterium]
MGAGVLVRALAVAVAAGLWAAGPGASLARAEGGSRVSLFADSRARQVGDLVRILIVERTEASTSASTGARSKGEVDVSGDGVLENLIPMLGGSGETRFDGQGRTVRAGSIKAQLTARVVEVLPGGLLRLEGRQTIRVNDEEQEMVLTGLVRAQDIGRDNSVLSSYLADARITLKGAGTLASKQRPGLLTRLLGWLF